MMMVRTVVGTAMLLLVSVVSLVATPPAAAQPTEPGPTEPALTGPALTEAGAQAPAASSATASEAAGAAAANQANPVGSLAGSVASGLADRALDSLFESIGEAAIWAFGKVLGWIDETSSPDVTQRWFSDTYARSYWLAATIALAALVWAITTAALRNGVTGVVGVLPRVLYVALGLAVAVPLVQTLLEFTDWLSAQVAGQTSQNLSDMAGTLGKVLVGGVGVAGVAARSGGIPAMVVGFLALIILVGALVVWLELIFRSAAIYLLLAAAAFPAALSINKPSAKPIRKVAAWIVALAFAKPVIVLAFWVGSAPFSANGGAGVAAVLTGAGTMTTAVFAPWALFRLFDFAGDQMTAAFAASASPERLRTHVEQPVTTYRRTATAVRERATTVRERGAEGFSPHRTRAVSAAASGSGGAATGGALVLAGSVAAASGAAASKRAVRGMAATEPGDTARRRRDRSECCAGRRGTGRTPAFDARDSSPAAESGGHLGRPSRAARPARRRATATARIRSDLIRRRSRQHLATSVRRPDPCTGTDARDGRTRTAPRACGARATAATAAPAAAGRSPRRREMTQVPTVRFAPAERATTWMNWRNGQWAIVLAGAAVFAAVSIAARTTTIPAAPALLLGVTAFVASLVLAKRPIGGEFVDERVPLTARRLLRRGRGELISRNPLPLVGTTGDGFTSVEAHAAAPATLQGVRFLEASDQRGRPFAVVHDTVCDAYSAVMRIEGQNSALADAQELESVLQVWGQILASVSTIASAVRRAQLLEVAAPDLDGTELYRYYTDRASRNGHAASSYRQLLSHAAPSGTVHETFVALQVSPDRSRRGSERRRVDRDAAMVKALAREMTQLSRVLHRYGIRVLDPMLSLRELARAIRYAFDPGARVDVSRRDDKVNTADGGVSLHGAWPLETDHRDADIYRTDGAHHATYWVQSWPERPVAATFLQPLLLNAQATRRFCVVFNPLSKSGELQAAQERMVLSESGEQLRREKQFSTTEETARRDEAIRRHVQEIADHEAPFTFSGWVAVSSPSVDQLGEDCDEVLDAASESFLELRRMRSVHDVTFTYLLPGVCRGLRGWN